MHFPVAVMLCDMPSQLTSISLNSKGHGQGHLVTFAKGCLLRMFWSTLYFLFETTRPGCIAKHHFGTVNPMSTKDQFMSKTSVPV